MRATSNGTEPGGADCSMCVLDRTAAASSSHCPPASPPLYEVRDQPLAAMLVASDGGSFSAEYSSRNMFVDDRTVYCSLASEGVNVIAQCSSNARRPMRPEHSVVESSSSSSDTGSSSPFLMTSIVVKVPPTGFTSPMGQAAIFTSWDYPDLEAIKHFDAVSSQQDFDRMTASYSSTTSCSSGAAVRPGSWTGITDKELAEDLFQGAMDSYMAGCPVALPGQPRHDWPSSQPLSPSSWVSLGAPPSASPLKESSDASRPVPRLFIDMVHSHEARFVLPSPVSGCFVVIKMLRAKYSHADNIDVQYFGLRGYTSPPCFGAGILV